MKITCPNCGEIITVHGLGRKRLPIPLDIIIEAFRTSNNNYSAAARYMTYVMGRRITPGFVHGRLKGNLCQLTASASPKK